MREKEKTFISTKHTVEDLKDASFEKKLEIFETRINDWFINPAKELSKNKDFGFPLVVISCVLVDTLSQFYYGSPKSKGEDFKRFLREKISDFNLKLPKPILHSINDRMVKLEDFADVFYHGFRCGILHEAKILYGEIEVSDKPMLRWVNQGKFGKLIIDPIRLLNKMENLFKTYLVNLKKDKMLKNNFEKKFNEYFSII